LCCFYRYIYVETARITDATALPLLYAAKKYLLTGLLQECRRASKKALTCSVDTVCAALQQSISLGEDELKEKSLKFVRENTRRVFNTEAFLHLPHNALEDVVSLDTVSETSERELFEACVKWARCQLRKLGNEHPSGEEIRNVLGDVLYKIRFPTMTQREFAGLTAHSKILSLDEKHDVYVYMTTGEKTETLKFEVQRRQQQENVISRFTRIGNEYWEYNDEMEASDAVRIQTTVDIRLTGVGLYGGTESSTHDVVLRVWKGDRFFRNGEILSTTETTITSDGSQTPVKIVLKKPVDIQANAMYTVEAVITGQRTWSGINNTSPTCHLTQSGKITFYESAMSVNGTDARRGQIPQLFYTKKQRR